VIAARDAGWLNMPLFPPAITWQAPDVATLPSWIDAKRVCLDVECRDDDLYDLGPGVRRGGYVCGIAFAFEDGPAHYLPIRHEGGGNLDPGQVWSYLRDRAVEFTGEVLFNMGPYDLDYLWENGIEFKKARRHLDVQNAEPILDEFQKTYGLDAICARRGIPGKDETELRAHATAWDVDPKTQLWRLPAGAVGRYAEQDVRAPLGLMRVQEKELAEQGLLGTFDLECRVTCPLVRMTRRGIRVDLDELDRVESWGNERLGSYLEHIYQLTGVRIGSISNATEVARALKARGFDVPMKEHAGTGKMMPSIQKLWLQQQTDEVAKAVVSGREFEKLLGTYVGGVRKHLIGDRLHPSYKQLRGASDEDEKEDDEGGARFGRCSARHPNVQAAMKRSKEIMKRWRKVYVADERKFWISGDYSSQEPRWTVHYSELCHRPGAKSAGDAFRANPLLDPYQHIVDLVKTGHEVDLGKLRDDMKEVYLARGYGMGGGKMALKLKLPTVEKIDKRNGRSYRAAGPEAQAIIDRFDGGVPYVMALAKLCTRSAQRKGYILGVDNRRLRFEVLPDGQLKDEHKAVSKLIQYAAAHQTKLALVALDAEGFPLQLTVHDEFDYSEDDDDRARHMGEVMCEVHRLRVPSRVDIKKGSGFGDLDKLCTVTSKGEFP
jgi:DNA polymerase I-like protein with 3'-5' exonuclease and polymerase domains